MTQDETNKILEVVLILILPPLAVWHHDRACTSQVGLNVVLLLLVFVIPSYIHAIWYCFLRDPPREPCPAQSIRATVISAPPPPYSKSPVVELAVPQTAVEQAAVNQ